MRGSGWGKSKALSANAGFILGVPDVVCTCNSSTKALETDLWGPPACQPTSSYGLGGAGVSGYFRLFNPAGRSLQCVRPIF